MFLYVVSTAGFLFASWVFMRSSKAGIGALPLWAAQNREAVTLLSTACSLACIGMLIAGLFFVPWYMVLLGLALGVVSGVLPPLFPLGFLAMIASVGCAIAFFAFAN